MCFCMFENVFILVCECMFVCVLACSKERGSVRISMCLRMCLCVSVCVCVCERERERARKRESFSCEMCLGVERDCKRKVLY